MKSEELKIMYQLRDRCVRVLSKDGEFRAVCVKNTKAAKEAMQKHQLDYEEAALLARTLAASSMLASFLKGEERVIVELEGDGIIRKVFAESMQLGEVRGYVRYNEKEGDSDLQSVGDFLGNGVLKVSKIMYNKTEPVTGIVPLQKGDVTSDLANYFFMSEQIPSYIILDVSFDNQGNIEESGGMIVQVMPGFSEKKLEEVYYHLLKINKLTEYFKYGENPLSVLKKVLPFEFDMLSSTQIDFFCRCSKDLFVQRLKTLDIKEIEEMKLHNENELTCQYCSSKYYLEMSDFDSIIEEMKALRN